MTWKGPAVDKLVAKDVLVTGSQLLRCHCVHLCDLYNKAKIAKIFRLERNIFEAVNRNDIPRGSRIFAHVNEIDSAIFRIYVSSVMDGSRQIVGLDVLLLLKLTTRQVVC